MKITFEKNFFRAVASFAEREQLKKAGFTWDPKSMVWFTRERIIAARLRDYMDEAALNETKNLFIDTLPWRGAIIHPQNLTPFPYQYSSARFCLERKRAYLGLDPGLGKTIVAALVFNSLKKKGVYVCPPFLIENVKREFSLWCGDNCINLLIVPDTMIAKDKTLLDIIMHIGKNSVLFVDEAHRFKNDAAIRSKAIYKKLVPIFDRVYFMSGTPMPSRPIELYAPLSNLAPETIGFRNKFQYGLHYCAGFKGPWGWDLNGASNMKELSRNVKEKFMVRIRKDEVLKELPSRREEIVFIGDYMPPKLANFEKEILNVYGAIDLMKEDIALAKGFENKKLLPLPTYRKELGEIKLEACFDFLEYLIEEVKEPLLIFAIHKNVVAALADKFKKHKPFIITGDTPMLRRQPQVDAFQRGESNVFIGNIDAMGVGYNLTRASRCAFVEFSYVPDINSQAIDRMHRIGQENPVIAHYLVYKNSIDRKVLEINFQKKSVTSHV